MASVFTKIIAGELPGRFVWTDDRAVGFLSIAPLKPGHTLVVPRQEVDKWTDAPTDLLAHCLSVAQAVGRGVERAWEAPRAGVQVVGFEVPHLHVHVFPAWGIGDFDWAKADHDADPAGLDEARDRLRGALRDLGYGAQVPSD